jgi:PPOX class probable F420-dependent enzyme
MGNDNLNDEAVQRLLRGKNFAFVSSLMKDGSPHITPTWVDIEDGNVLVNTAIGRTKQRNLSRDNRIAISVADQNNPYDMVTIRGKVKDQITGTEADEHIDKLAKKYLGKDKYPYRSPEEKRVILKIEPKKVVHMKQ